jgi:hypothetical protein
VEQGGTQRILSHEFSGQSGRRCAVYTGAGGNANRATTRYKTRATIGKGVAITRLSTAAE